MANVSIIPPMIPPVLSLNTVLKIAEISGTVPRRKVP